MQNNIHYIISFPRSGQGLIENFLRFYCKSNNIEYSYCEFYSTCEAIPCKCKNKSIFQKNHDFELKDYHDESLKHRQRISIKEDSKYLVLYRSNMLEQLESYFRYKNSRWIKNNSYFERYKDANNIVMSGREKCIYYNEQQRKELYDFIKQNANYYFNFLNKWVLNDLSNILKIDYDKLLQDPFEFCKVIKFFFNDNDSKNIVEEFQKINKVEKKHEVSFSYERLI